jgi:predicted O-methyltransferase YrrM
MDLPPNKVLADLLTSQMVKNAEGRMIPSYAAISPAHAMALYRTVLKYRPRQIVEIGMCFGVSTLAMLTALQQINEGGRLISIDPWQTSPEHEKGAGLQNVRSAGLDSLHELIEKPSHAALPELLARGHRIDFAYIDGNHMFDYALLDFFYLDKMLKPDGIIGFNDCGWQSIHHVVRFVRTHRKYRELDVGLPKNYESRRFLFSLIRRLEGRSSTDRYFQKLETWEPDGNFFRRF